MKNELRVPLTRVRKLAAEKIRAGLTVTGKHERHDAVATVKKEVKTALAEDYAGRDKKLLQHSKKWRVKHCACWSCVRAVASMGAG